LNGDRNGSPNGAPGQSTPFSFSFGNENENEQGTDWDAPGTPGFGIPSTDVKVAGAPAAGATALLSPPRDEWPRDEVADADGIRPAGYRSGISLGRFTLPKIAVVAAVAVVVVGGGAVGAFALTGGSDGTTAAVVPSKPAAIEADPANDPAARAAAAAAERRQILDRASKAARKAAAKRPALGVKGTPLPTPTPSASASAGGGGGGTDPIPAGEAQTIAKGMLAGFGFSGSGEFGCLVNLWNRESHWNTHASNPSGAYGIPQAMPGSKMSSAGADWQNSARTQIKWGLGYIKSRYSTPCGAWSHSQSVGWY
jgi:hypothetical protein